MSKASGPVEVGAFQLLDCLTKIKQPAFGRQVKKAKRAGDTKPSAMSYSTTVALIHQQQVGMKGPSQSDSGGFSFIKAGHQR